MRYFLLAIIALAFLVMWFQRRQATKLNNEEREELERFRRNERKRAGKHALPQGEPMLCCAHCQTYFPKAQALWHGDDAFCSQRCREKGAR